MSYFEMNMEAIDSSKHYLSEKLRKYNEDMNKLTLDKLAKDKLQVVPTHDGDSTIVYTYNGRPYRLNSIFKPGHEANRWVQQFEMLNLGIVVSMFGIGNGVFVREMLNRLGNRGILFIYEPSIQMFNFILENYDITDIITAGNVSITVEGINDNEYKNLLSAYVDWYNLRSQIVCIHPQYDKIFEGNLATFHKIIGDNNNRVVVNKNTDIANSKIIIDNIIKNLWIIKKCSVVTDLIGIFPKEIPAIIVAAGPSLDKNIDDLKLAKGKAVIFAVDTAVKYLLAHQIIPDFIVTLDPEKSLHHLADPICKEIPLFCRIDSRPESIEINEKRIILYNLEGYVKSIYSRLGIETGSIHAGGSVATGAFSICETMGFQHVILVGQDLAYSGEATHAGGLVTDVSRSGRYTEIVEDIYGNPIKTRYDWYVYIRWFEDAVELFDGEEVIDATEGGAKIKGTTIISLKAAIEKYCISEINCNDIIDHLKPTLDYEMIEITKDIIKQDLKELAEMSPKLEEALELSEKLITKYDRSIHETKSSLLKNKRISDINEEVQEKVIYELLDWDISRDTTDQISDIYIYTEDELKNKLTTYQHAKTIYQALIKSVERLKPMLEEALRVFVSE